MRVISPTVGREGAPTASSGKRPMRVISPTVGRGGAPTAPSGIDR
jgi:hypothetical protein